MPSEVPSEPPPDYDDAAAQHGVSPLPQASAPSSGPNSGTLRRNPVPLELPILTYLRSKRVILASASPRRKALLAQVGLTNLEIQPSTKPENLSKTSHTPNEYVSATARQKCLDVYEALLSAGPSGGGGGGGDPDVVIAADTVIVTRGGTILEKPRSAAEHVRMLRHLRDTQSHRVMTAVCVLAPRADARHPGYELAAHTEETRVVFADVGDDVIEAYVRMREGADKAGGYAVQGVGGLMLVERVEGSVDNVVGLPVRKCLELCERVVFRQSAEDEDGEEGEDEEGQD